MSKIEDHEAPFVWKSYSLFTRIPSVDRQHKEFFELLAHLAQEHDPAVNIRTSIKQLLSLAESHARLEEVFLLRNSYPFLAEHANEHSALIAELSAVLNICEEDRTSLRNAFQKVFILFRDHVLISDMKYAAFVLAERKEAEERSLECWFPDADPSDEYENNRILLKNEGISIEQAEALLPPHMPVINTRIAITETAEGIRELVDRICLDRKRMLKARRDKRQWILLGICACLAIGMLVVFLFSAYWITLVMSFF